jgi:DNA-binding beta-propeller fold protein YncE
MSPPRSRGLLNGWTSLVVTLGCIAALQPAIQSGSAPAGWPEPHASEAHGTSSPIAALSPFSRGPSPTTPGGGGASRAGPEVASAISTIDLLNGTSETGIYTPPFQGDPFDVTPDDLDHKLFLPEPGTGGTISSGDNTLAVVDLVSGNVSSEIYGGPNPEFTFLDPEYDRLYVGDASSAALRVYDASTDQFIQTINLTGAPGQMVRDPGTGALYVTEGGSGGLAEVDPATESATASVHLGSGPMWAAFDSVTNDVIVGDAYDDDLWSVNATTLTVNGLNSNFGPMSGIAVDPLSGWFFVGINYGAGLGWVEALNGSVNGSKQKFSPPYLETGGLAYDPVNENIYFADVAHSAVYPINASTLTLGSLIRVGGGPDAIAYDVVSGHLLVADTYGFAVTEVDPATTATVRTVHTNAFPTGIIYDAVNSRLAILGYPSGEALVKTSGTAGWRTVACASSYSYLVGIPDRGEQLAAGGSGLCVLNATTEAPIVQFGSPNSETVTALSFDPSRGQALVGTQSSGSPAHGFLYFLNTSDWAVERTVACNHSPFRAA